MIFPGPDDPARAPVWDNYITAQVSQAALGLIPQNALAVGVEVDRYNVRLRFQLSRLTDEDALDIDDIVAELADLLGDKVQVGSVHEVRDAPLISPHDGVYWIYLARSAES